MSPADVVGRKLKFESLRTLSLAEGLLLHVGILENRYHSMDIQKRIVALPISAGKDGDMLRQVAFLIRNGAYCTMVHLLEKGCPAPYLDTPTE